MSTPSPSDKHTPPTPSELAQALTVQVYDETGQPHTLADLVAQKRTALIFIRHFWCLNCQAYIRHLSHAAPPHTLPPNTQVLIIGCGSHQPIKKWIEASHCLFNVYTDPENRLHRIFGFKSTLSNQVGDHGPRDYMRDQGGSVQRWVGGVKAALGDLGMLWYVGPKGLNGGEVLVGEDGSCEYMARMQSTVDHTDVSELASLLGRKTEG